MINDATGFAGSGLPSGGSFSSKTVLIRQLRRSPFPQDKVEKTCAYVLGKRKEFFSHYPEKNKFRFLIDLLAPQNHTLLFLPGSDPVFRFQTDDGSAFDLFYHRYNRSFCVNIPERMQDNEQQFHPFSWMGCRKSAGPSMPVLFFRPGCSEPGSQSNNEACLR